MYKNVLEKNETLTPDKYFLLDLTYIKENVIHKDLTFDLENLNIVYDESYHIYQNNLKIRF